MLSKIAGLLKSEMSRAAATFIATQSKFLSLLEAYKEKLPDDSVPEAPEVVETPRQRGSRGVGRDDGARGWCHPRGRG